MEDLKITKYPASKLVEIVERYRINNCLSKTQIAEKIGLSISSYSNLYAKRHTDSEVYGSTVERVAKALNMELKDFLEAETKEKRYERIISSLPDVIIDWLDTANGRAAVFQLFRIHYEALQEHKRKSLQAKLRANLSDIKELWDNAYAESNPNLDIIIKTDN